MKLLILKQQLISELATKLLCKSQMLIHTITMSNFGDTLTTQGFDAIFSGQKHVLT